MRYFFIILSLSFSFLYVYAQEDAGNVDAVKTGCRNNYYHDQIDKLTEAYGIFDLKKIHHKDKALYLSSVKSYLNTYNNICGDGDLCIYLFSKERIEGKIEPYDESIYQICDPNILVDEKDRLFVLALKNNFSEAVDYYYYNGMINQDTIKYYKEFCDSFIPGESYQQEVCYLIF